MSHSPSFVAPLCALALSAFALWTACGQSPSEGMMHSSSGDQMTAEPGASVDASGMAEPAAKPGVTKYCAALGNCCTQLKAPRQLADCQMRASAGDESTCRADLEVQIGRATCTLDPGAPAPAPCVELGACCPSLDSDEVVCTHTTRVGSYFLDGNICAVQLRHWKGLGSCQ